MHVIAKQTLTTLYRMDAALTCRSEMKPRSLFLLFEIISTLFLLIAICWFIQQSCSFRSTQVSDLFQKTVLQQTRPPHSEIDLQLFKSWKQGVVTRLEPEIPRNCAALFTGTNQTEISRVTEANRNWNSSEYDLKFANLFLDSEGCEEIRTEFDRNFYTSDEELSFPLAFSINIHSGPQQIVRFLKAIYRPHNVYCIHYDQKSSSEVKRVFSTLNKCLHNVFIPRRLLSISWGCHPILDAQLSCMSALLKLRRKFRWKYVTTLCGKELPLRTNREMVSFFKGMEGHPVIHTSEFSSEDYSYKFHRTRIDPKTNSCKSTNELQTAPVPYGMKLLKTMAYFSLTPEFTDFVTHSTKARALYEFVKPIRSPEEAFYGTLLHAWINSKSEPADRSYPRSL